MRSEGSRFTWGSGGEAVFAKFCVCVRNPQWRVRLEGSRNCVTLSRVAAVVLVFAEEVSVRGICVAAVILVSAAEVSV